MSHDVYVPCQKCESINRVEIEKLNGGPKCANCKSPLDFSKPIHVNDKNFGKVVKESGLPVLVDFWAPWCGPCRVIAPIIEKMAVEKFGSVMVAKVNTDESQTIAAEYEIRGIPTLILFQEGKEVARQVGTVPTETVEAMLENARV